MRSAILLGVGGGLLLAIATQGARAPAESARQERRPAIAAPLRATLQSALVTVPFFGNEKCPLDGRPVARDKFFALADGQRLYACSDACVEAIGIDAANMLKKAYPETRRVAARSCPVCGTLIDVNQPLDVTFQGEQVTLCSPACVLEFRRTPILFLVRLTHQDAQDVRNEKCPIEGDRVDHVTYVIYKNSLVGLSSPACVAAFEKDPDAALARARK